jgi:hypothetical protein
MIGVKKDNDESKYSRALRKDDPNLTEKDLAEKKKQLREEMKEIGELIAKDIFEEIDL